MGFGGWLEEQLFDRRIVLVTGRLGDDAAAKAAAALLSLNARGNEPIELHLDSPGGDLGAAFVLMDTSETLRLLLRVSCRGQVGGPVIGLLTVADHRVAAPNARFHLTQPTVKKFAGTRRQSPHGAGSRRTCSGGSTGVWPGAQYSPPMRSPRTCGVGATWMRGKRSTTVSSTRSPQPGRPPCSRHHSDLLQARHPSGGVRGHDARISDEVGNVLGLERATFPLEPTPRGATPGRHRLRESPIPIFPSDSRADSHRVPICADALWLGQLETGMDNVHLGS